MQNQALAALLFLYRHVLEQIVHARLVHQEDLACGWGETWLPDAIARKLPNVFPASRRWHDQDDREGRHHLHETVVQRAVSEVARTSGLDKRVTCRTFRHSLQPTFSSAATTSGRCRSSSDTATSRRP